MTAGDHDHDHERTVPNDEIPSPAAIRDRPHPKTMALPCIWAEADDLGDYRQATTDGDLIDAIDARFRQMHRTLKDRLNVSFPVCPECGGTLGREYDGVLTCDAGHALTDTVRAEYNRAEDRLWGQRGHGDREVTYA